MLRLTVDGDQQRVAIGITVIGQHVDGECCAGSCPHIVIARRGRLVGATGAIDGHSDGAGGLCALAVANNVGQVIFAHKGRVGRVGDMLPVGGGYAKLRLADRKHRQHIAIGIGIIRHHIQRNRRTLPGNRAVGDGIGRFVAGVGRIAEVAAGLDCLETTLRDVDPQHASLRAVFNSSWRLLAVAEQRVLARLTVFRGGFSMEAARIVAQALPVLLQTLRNKSLLRSAGSRRYDMHALIQQFAAEVLASASCGSDAVQRAHRHTFLTLLAEQAVVLDTRAARQAIDQIQPDWGNVAAAWQHAVAQRALALLAAALDGLVYFCDLRGLFVEAQTLLEQALSVLQQDGSLTAAHAEPAATNQDAVQRLQLHCRLLTALAYFASRRHLPSTNALAQQALGLAYQIDSTPEVISNLLTQARVFGLAAAYAQGVVLAEKALGIAQAAQLKRHAGLCLDRLGSIAYLAGDFARAQNHFQQVLLIHEQTSRLEQRRRAAIGYLDLVTAELGRLDVALHYSQRYLESCERMEDRRNLAHAQHCLAYVRLRLGYFAEAVTLDGQIAAAEAIGDRDLHSFALHTQLWAYRHLGQFPAALYYATEAVALARGLDAPLTLVFALTHLAEAQLETAQNAAELGASDGQLSRSHDHCAYDWEVHCGLRSRNRAGGAISPLRPDRRRAPANCPDPTALTHRYGGGLG